MTNKLLKKLVEYSYTKNKLDENKVLSIADKLTRKELKKFIHGLKNAENKRNVLVFTATELSDSEKKSLLQQFPDKSVEFSLDESLLSGIKIQDNDIIYESSLNESFEKLKDTLLQEND